MTFLDKTELKIQIIKTNYIYIYISKQKYHLALFTRYKKWSKRLSKKSNIYVEFF